MEEDQKPSNMKRRLVTTVLAAGLALAASLAVAAEPAVSRFKPMGRQQPALVWRIPTAPLFQVMSVVAAPLRRVVPLPNSSPLARRDGWTSLTFDLNDQGSALFLEVQGKAEFETADILCEGGQVISVDLRHEVRGGGLYQLHDLGGQRRVSLVRVTARAQSGTARVGLRLGLDG